MSLPSTQRSILSTALRISGLYLVFGMGWVLAGDWIQEVFQFDSFPFSSVAFQTIKGGIFVVITAVLLFGLIYVMTKRTFESERTYKELFLANPHPMFIYEPVSLHILKANQAACTFFNYHINTLTDLTLYDLHPKVDHERLRMITAGPRPLFFKSGLWEMLKKDGEMVIVNIQSFETTIDGKTTRLVAAYDLTETIRAQKSLEDTNASLRFANDRLQKQDMELRQLYQRFDLARQSAGIGIWEWWPQKQVFLWDPQLSQLLDDQQGAGYHDLNDFTSRMRKADSGEFLRRISESAEEGKFEMEFQLQSNRTSGSKWIHLSGKFLKKSHSTDPEERVIGVAWDISALKQQELALIETKRNQDALINNTEDLIWSVDNQLRLVSFNIPFQQFMAATLNKIFREGDVFLTDYPEDTQHEWGGFYSRALQGESFYVRQKSINPYSGSATRMETKFFPILDDNHEIMGVSCFSRDITQLVDNAKKLALQNKVLEKIAWIAVHELRGPLTRAMTVADSLNLEAIEDSFQRTIIKSLEITLELLDSLVTRMALMAEEAQLRDSESAPNLFPDSGTSSGNN